MTRRLIIDPEVLPVEGTSAGLPPIDRERMTPSGMRDRFARHLEWTTEPSEFRVLDGVDPRSAAVLVPLVVRDAGLTVLLTQRADHLNDHAGQVSFPGGRREPFDPDATATALREAKEEIGLAGEQVEILGALPDYLTGTGFCVTPVVGLVHPPFTVQADTFEVAEIFEVPLAFLMNPANHQIRTFRWDGGERRFFAMPYPRGDGSGDYFIWGATAGMLRNLYRFLVAK
ncbi:coenzyme A pyrophosphatase [Burkholderia ubonensis]|uniref:Coenzyme A pyrophosphatase n=1 Tax=Burkholderia ubonensis TaxID=101571 RepID=A0AB73G695_9BURK|nr:CoA pyrophosphatase [Burkholderia ubonensis]KVC78521.1 coenzyme A pyrophosphatase [Burkholderia ubonensis]KVD18953.1 coenzyme A pyrophosphatase [Burkholderia ubonensis]KVG74554.1 coenzyme A pyrophosphatase [Burkholderia ubonensis]KVH25138.1 coenzyme A pyrophosphatase [Burkholderia ubonensis]KVH51915.1 coenzyme A pyrophosphatase [Burkholderia ubonensis]